MSPTTRFSRLLAACLLTLLAVLISSCGGGGSGGDAGTPPPATVWVTVTSTSVTSSTATLGGTSWVSQSYFASNCVGLGCLLDTTRTNDYPGVNVTWANLTTGAAGSATSYYGPGTNWVHEWTAQVPVRAGRNTLRIAAFDPSGTGGSITIDVDAPPPLLAVQSVFPASGATTVPVNTTIVATFTEPVDPLTVTPASFTVTGPAGVVPGSLSATSTTATFTPSDYLDYDAVYTVTLTSALASTSGQPLPANHSWTFTAGYTAGEYRSVWSSSPTDVFIVGFGPILHYDGKGIFNMTIWDVASQFNTSPFFHTLYGIWGSSVSDVFAVGDYGTILHYDGNSWTAQDSGSTATLVDVWGSSASNIFVVGYETPASGIPTGIILHYDGTAWTTLAPAPAGGLYSIWGSGANDVFAAGIDTFLHYDGNTWTTVDPGTGNVQFQGLWGSGANDVFAVGSPYTLMHYDGSSWSAMPPAPAVYMYGVWGSAPDSVFAVGSAGTILFYNGSTWTNMPAPSTAHELFNVWGNSDSDVFAVGAFSGVIFHYDGSNWSILP